MDQSIDKSARSCFVGNIPYEATEEKLKEIFSSVGPVVSFKLVYDRDNGKPRGYGFCEFMDPETAMSAMRNLNGVEINGRALRVDSASNERSELQNLPQGSGAGGIIPNVPTGQAPIPAEPSMFGDSVDPEKAPEAITKAVASLPPEQMFELMRQMKECIVNNPQEARDMLLKNPQLAYALLQALVVMKIVDPEMAVSMLHKQAPKPMALGSQQGINPRMDLHMPPDHGRMEERFDRRDPRGERYPDRDPRDRYRDTERDPRGHRDPRGGSSGSSRRQMEGGDDLASMQQQAILNSDPDKAQLIMQVLQLTDAQIALLPPDQRASILELKKQIGHVSK